MYIMISTELMQHMETGVEQLRTEQVLQLADEIGMLRPCDLQMRGIPRVYLQRLYKRGLLQRSGRGLYFRMDADITEHHTLAEACKRVPHGVICLLSALRFHDLTTQNAHLVWMAISNSAHLPRLDYPRLRVIRFSGKALTDGVEDHKIDGVNVRIYNAAKTVADCFKFRNKIGLDVAIEALRDYWRARMGSLDDLSRYAKICRVANIMRPYLESLIS
jgi:predicted transcriptional regulator of viral defense system